MEKIKTSDITELSEIRPMPKDQKEEEEVAEMKSQKKVNRWVMWLVADCERQSNHLKLGVLCLLPLEELVLQEAALSTSQGGQLWADLQDRVHNMKGFFEKCNQIYR